MSGLYVLTMSYNSGIVLPYNNTDFNVVLPYQSIYQSIQGSHSLGHRKFHDFSRTFQAPRSIIPGPCRKPAMFKNSNKQQLKSLGERCKLCQPGPGRNPSRESIFGIPAVQKMYLMDTIMAILKLKTAKYIIVYQIPGLSRTLQVYFQDFPGPRSFSGTFQVPEIFQ